MFTAGDVYATLIRLMHRAGRGEGVVTDLDELIVRLEQAKASQPLPDWRQSIVNLRGWLMTHFAGPLATSETRMKDPAEVRRVSFAETAIDRLGGLMASAA